MFRGRSCTARASKDTDNWSLTELREIAKDYKIGGYRRRGKLELCDILSQIESQPVRRSPTQSPRRMRRTPRRKVRQVPVAPVAPVQESVLLPQLNRDELILITDKLYVPDILNLCQSSRSFRQLCQDDRFWARRYRQDFGNDVKRYPTWRQQYINAYQDPLSTIVLSNLGRSLINRATPFLDYLDLSELEYDRQRGVIWSSYDLERHVNNAYNKYNRDFGSLSYRDFNNINRFIQELYARLGKVYVFGNRESYRDVVSDRGFISLFEDNCDPDHVYQYTEFPLENCRYVV